MPRIDEPPSQPPLVERGDYVYTPDGHRLEGWIENADPCPRCRTPVVFAVAFDAYGCLHCNRWLEDACEDPGCDYCRRRPATPLPS